MSNHPNLRITSIDALRAITMLLMIFVNDLWSLKDIPSWLEHTAAEADDMGLADTVFPAFLFIVGMSIPLSVQQRRQKGSTIQVTGHILVRAVALLTMGLFLVNGEYINEQATGIQRVVWNMICCTAFILLWNNWPKSASKPLLLIIKLIAMLALLFLAWIYRGDGATRFTTHWWGILGLIGWAYLVSALIYLFVGNNLYLLTLAWAIFLFTSCAAHAGWINNSVLQKILSPFGEGAMPAFTTGGVITTVVVLRYRQANKTSKMMLTLLVIAIFLFALGVYLRGFWGISKIRATPAWVLICSAITILVFLVVYWLTDIKKKTGWLRPIQPAGTNTLLCYLLPYYAYGLITLFPIYLPAALLTGGIGLLKSFAFALLIIMITGLLGKLGLRLKL